MNRRERGMTLLELLVALAVLSLIATAAYAGLRDGTRVAQQLETQRDLWRQLEIAHRLLGDDLADIRVLPASNAFIAHGDEGKVTAGPWLELVRSVALDFRDDAAAPYRAIGYALQDSALVRVAAGAAGASTDALLPGISELRARYLDATRHWSHRWPPEGASTIEPPRALELTFSLAGHGEFRWVFHVGLAP